MGSPREEGGRKRTLRKVLTAETGKLREELAGSPDNKRKRTRSSGVDLNVIKRKPRIAKDEKLVNSLKLSLGSVLGVKIWNVPLESLPVVQKGHAASVSFVSEEEIERCSFQVPTIIFEIVEHLIANGKWFLLFAL